MIDKVDWLKTIQQQLVSVYTMINPSMLEFFIIILYDMYVICIKTS